MADEPKIDKLAQRIAQRRASAGQPDTQSTVDPAFATESTIAKTQSSAQNIERMVANAKEAISAGQNPLAVARLLSEIMGAGMKNKDLAAAIGMNKSWLSKRLGLLSAPIKVQQLIESGGLSESEYHNNRKNVASQIKSRAGTLEYQRMPQVTISIEAAKSLASILQILADQHGASPIKLETDASKKDITSILNYRAGDVLGLIK